MTAEGERTWCVVVAHHARGAATARRRLTTFLGDLINADLLRDALSVVGELVCNSVQHAEPLPGGVIRVAFRMRSDLEGVRALEVRVTDGGANQPPQQRSAGAEATSGRGLAIVSALASQWGVERDALGQSVWAEIPSRQLAVA